MTALLIAYIAWIVFMVGWVLAGVWTARGTTRAGARTQVGYYAGYVLGFGLLFSVRLPGAGHVTPGFAGLLPHAWTRPLWSAPPAVGALLVAVQLAGFAFATWARLHLGRLWSGMLTLREGHRVVDTGPYRRVRHPIYTGFILAAAGLAGLEGSPAALAGCLIVAAVMAVKARYEEGFLRAELGAAAYDAYAARTPMLLPGLAPGPPPGPPRR